MKRSVDRFDALARRLAGTGPVAVAFSGGADSTLLLAAAHEALGNDVLAVTVRSCAVPEEETAEAVRFCRERGIRHETVDFDPLAVPEFAANSPGRCYHCKLALMNLVRRTAQAHGISRVFEGSNADDAGDYRPGMKALAECGVESPLMDSGMTKAEIRERLRDLGFPAVADKPSSPCLASRFPYGETITREGLERVAAAERAVRRFLPPGAPLRVRSCGTTAKIETGADGFGPVAAVRGEIAAALRRIGFGCVALDLEDFRSGRLNDGLRG